MTQGLFSTVVEQLSNHKTTKQAAHFVQRDDRWVLLYGHPTRLETMLKMAEDENFAHTTIMSMTLQHLGQDGTAMLNTQLHLIVTKFGKNSYLDTKYFHRPSESQRRRIFCTTSGSCPTIHKQQGGAKERGRSPRR